MRWVMTLLRSENEHHVHVVNATVGVQECGSQHTSPASIDLVGAWGHHGARGPVGQAPPRPCAAGGSSPWGPPRLLRRSTRRVTAGHVGAIGGSCRAFRDRIVAGTPSPSAGSPPTRSRRYGGRRR